MGETTAADASPIAGGRHRLRRAALFAAAAVLIPAAGATAIFLLHRTMYVPGAAAPTAAVAPGARSNGDAGSRPGGGPASAEGTPMPATAARTAGGTPAGVAAGAAGAANESPAGPAHAASGAGQPTLQPDRASAPVSLRVPMPGPERFDPGVGQPDPRTSRGAAAGARGATPVDGSRPQGPRTAEAGDRSQPPSLRTEVLRGPVRPAPQRPGEPRRDAAAPAATPAATPAAASEPAAQASQPQPAPPPRPAPAQRLAQAQQAQCADAGMISRFVCDERVRLRFCRDRWNAHPDCQVEAARNNQQSAW